MVNSPCNKELSYIKNATLINNTAGWVGGGLYMRKLENIVI